MDFVKVLEAEFKANANPEIASGQKAYMKNRFEFYGIQAPVRREIQKPFFQKSYLPPKKDLPVIIKTLWNKPQREFQYFGQELATKYTKNFNQEDMTRFEYMITHKSWWDTVDFIAQKIVGEYFKTFPEQRDKYVQKWLASGNIWLQRTAILFQLKYKENIDTNLLSEIIHSLSSSKEFFINKAIGWILREYSKTNPEWVWNFVQKAPLDKLSYKEAIRLLS